MCVRFQMHHRFHTWNSDMNDYLGYDRHYSRPFYAIGQAIGEGSEESSQKSCRYYLYFHRHVTISI